MYQDNLEDLVKIRTNQLERTQDIIITSMGTLAEYRDLETGEHIKRTKAYVECLANYLSRDEKYAHALSKENIEWIVKSAPLHDIGKIGVPDSILLKPGKLTESEFEEMKKHTLYGKDAIKLVQEEMGYDNFLKYGEEIAFTHHEKWDGSGYPRGLIGDEIPVPGRIMALADVYDALVNARVYKAAFSKEEAKKIILEGKGSHFDPSVVDAFISLESKFTEIANKYSDA